MNRQKGAIFFGSQQCYYPIFSHHNQTTSHSCRETIEHILLCSTSFFSTFALNHHQFDKSLSPITMRRVIRFLFRVTLILFLWSVGSVVLYRYVPVPITPLMLREAVSSALKGEPTTFHHEWVPMEEISPHFANAVIASEDQRFYQHNGFDWEAIGDVIEERMSGKRKRGGSTISQQTAKNLFTFCTSTWARKGIETYYTVLIEWIWPKERILEVYLNSIEMGPAIYGAEAVARQHFNKSASKLTRSECALIAATLPNPKRYSSKNPSSYMRRRQNTILRQMQLMGK